MIRNSFHTCVFGSQRCAHNGLCVIRSSLTSRKLKKNYLLRQSCVCVWMIKVSVISNSNKPSVRERERGHSRGMGEKEVNLGKLPFSAHHIHTMRNLSKILAIVEMLIDIVCVYIAFIIFWSFCLQFYLSISKLSIACVCAWVFLVLLIHHWPLKLSCFNKM